VTGKGNHWLGCTQGMNTDSDTIWSNKARRFSTIMLNNKKYTGDITEVDDIYPMYLQRRIGIIGWKKDNKTFNLIRYNIVP
jgi:hypothetical protein